MSEKSSPNKLPENQSLISKSIDLLKVIAPVFFGSAIASLVTYSIQSRELINELKINEREALEEYFLYTIDGDVYKRLILAEYFQHVLSDEKARERWESYRESQEELLKNYKRLTIEAAKLKQGVEELNLNSQAQIENEIEEIIQEKLMNTTIEVNPRNSDTVNTIFEESHDAHHEDSNYTYEEEILDPTYIFNKDLESPIIQGLSLTWNDATKSGTCIPINKLVENNIINIARELRKIREQFGGGKLIIDSWYKTPTINRLEGGSKKSYHKTGHAVKFSIEEVEPDTIRDVLDPTWQGGLSASSFFVHIDLRGYKGRWSYGF